MFVTLATGLGVQSAFLTSLAGFFPAEGIECSNNILNVSSLLSLTLA